MKKLVSSILLVAGLVPGLVFADTINFKGSIRSKTCDISIGGSTGTTVVTLPDIGATDLSAAGHTAGDTTFNIDFANCPSALTSATVIFSGVNPTTTGNLGNNSGTAQNVEIQLLDALSSRAIKFDSGIAADHSSSKVGIDPATNSVSIPFIARYYATAQVTAGTVEATANFGVSYN